MQKRAEEIEKYEEEKPKKEAPIRMHIFRRTFDYLINLEPTQGKKIRENIRDGISITEEQKSTKGYLWKVMVVKLSEKNPLLLAVGTLCWVYLVTLIVLKLTIMA